jgi:hypothetical protein
LVLFYRGKIVAVSSGSVRDTFGNMLVCRGLISEDDLTQAIEAQHLSLEQKRLGAILVEAGKVRPEAVESVVREQMQAEMAALMEWPAGFFRFDAMPVEGPHDVELSTQEFVIVRRETNSWTWPLFQIGYMTATAWLASFIVYQAGRALGFS